MGPLLSEIYAITVISGSLVFDIEQSRAEPVALQVAVSIPEGKLLHEEVPLAELEIPLELHDIHAALSTGRELSLPTELQETLRSTLTRSLSGPLWLEFRRPYGYLPMMPWERMLASVVDVPILRLPVSPVPAVAGTKSLRIAVCVPMDATQELQEFLRQVVQGLPMRTRVDVFTRISPTSLDIAQDIDVTFHQPPAAGDCDMAPTTLAAEYGSAEELDNPWLRWIAETIAPGSVDVVHFVCPGRLSRNFGMLDFGDSPAGEAMERSLRLVSAGQLLSCLTQIGAWSLSLASPGRGETGLRVIAHRMSGLVSGPVVLHAPAAGHADELASAYRFLYAPDPSPPATTPTVAIACHPGWIRAMGTSPAPPIKEDELERALSDAVKTCTLDHGLVGEELRGAVEPPAWLAANQRILERWTASVYPAESDPADKGDSVEGVTHALQFISDAIEDSVRENRGIQ